MPSIPNVDPVRSPLDAFRLAVAQSLNKGLPQIPIDKAYESIDISRKGVDFTVAIPRFRLGGKPDEFAKKAAESVSD